MLSWVDGVKIEDGGAWGCGWCSLCGVDFPLVAIRRWREGSQVISVSDVFAILFG